MESDSENEALELVNISEDERIAALNALPEASKKKYEASYKLFMDWRNRQKITSFSENVLMTYFTELAKQYKGSTLWTLYSMLRALLKINNNADISKYQKLKAFLKRQSTSYKPKRSKAFTSNEIKRFMKEAPDEEYLLAKVALIMGVMGACRRQELYQMKTTHLKDLGSIVLVTIPDMKTKVRKFTITGNFYDIFKRYANLRPPNVNDSCFFLNYHRGKCTMQRLGINKFGAMGKQIAKYLKLPSPESYTGHSFYRSSAAFLAGGHVTSLEVWKSTTSGEASVETKLDITDSFLNSINSSTNIVTASNMESYENVNPLSFQDNFTYHHEVDLDDLSLNSGVLAEVKIEPISDDDSCSDKLIIDPFPPQGPSSFTNVLSNSESTETSMKHSIRPPVFTTAASTSIPATPVVHAPPTVFTSAPVTSLKRASLDIDISPNKRTKRSETVEEINIKINRAKLECVELEVQAKKEELGILQRRAATEIAEAKIREETLGFEREAAKVDLELKRMQLQRLKINGTS